MTDAEPQAAIIDWGWAGSALEVVSGDLHVVLTFRGGGLVALFDGLGHGPEAAAASSAAMAVLHERPDELPLRLVQQCHEALRRTRGVAMSLASFRAADSSLTWIGVGNVDGVLLRAAHPGPERLDEAINVRGGVVGLQLPPLRATMVLVEPGDTLIMATDGIRSGFATGVSVEHSPQEIAESILARFGRRTDDAHVVVARYLGEGA